jgi:hypothetical protein
VITLRAIPHFSPNNPVASHHVSDGVKTMKSVGLGLVVFFLAMALLHAEVRVEQVPEHGLQPEVAVAPNGTVHLVYLRGDPKAADVRYTSRQPGGNWEQSKTVNTTPRTAAAIGSIRGPQIALGASSAVHVVWNGVVEEKAGRAPLLYARLLAGAADFEKQRDLLANTTALDGGASVAADAKGSVWIAWHGNPPGEKPDEAQRVVFLRTSIDGGTHFAEPAAANASTPGVCACCSLRIVADASGAHTIFFRNALRTEHRAMTLLFPELDQWKSREVETWDVSACPMSSAALFPDRVGLLGAWETAGKIKVAWLTEPSATPVTLADDDAKHPAIASSPGSKERAGTAAAKPPGWNSADHSRFVQKRGMPMACLPGVVSPCLPRAPENSSY